MLGESLLISTKNVKKCNSHYYENMTTALSKEWCKKQLFLIFDQGTTILTDSGPSYCLLSEKHGHFSTRKADLIQFLQKRIVLISPEVKTKELSILL